MNGPTTKGRSEIQQNGWPNRRSRVSTTKLLPTWLHSPISMALGAPSVNKLPTNTEAVSHAITIVLVNVRSVWALWQHEAFYGAPLSRCAPRASSCEPAVESLTKCLTQGALSTVSARSVLTLPGRQSHPNTVRL